MIAFGSEDPDEPVDEDSIPTDLQHIKDSILNSIHNIDLWALNPDVGHLPYEELRKLHFATAIRMEMYPGPSVLSCLLTACYGESSCAALCSIINIGSSGTKVGAQCTVSMAAACVYISITH